MQISAAGIMEQFRAAHVADRPGGGDEAMAGGQLLD
jgi:hypothetical protein